MSIDTGDLEKSAYSPQEPSYGSRIRSLLPAFKLSRKGKKRIYMSDSKSLTPIVRSVFKKQSVYVLACEYRSYSQWDDDYTTVIEILGGFLPFIWTNRSKNQLFIQSENGTIVQVDTSNLESTLTPVQQDFLRATLEKDEAKYAEIVASEKRAFSRSIDEQLRLS